MKLEVMSKHVPVRHLRRFEPFTAQNTPRGSFMNIFSAISSSVSSDSCFNKIGTLPETTVT